MSTAEHAGVLRKRVDDVVDDLAFAPRIAVVVRDIHAVPADEPDTKHKPFHVSHTRRRSSAGKFAARAADRRRRRHGGAAVGVDSMPEAQDHPIAYTALQPGTPVQTEQRVQLATEPTPIWSTRGSSVFDGIVVQRRKRTRFVDADQIGSIHAGLHPHDTFHGAGGEPRCPMRRPGRDEAAKVSMADGLGRMLGRGKR